MWESFLWRFDPVWAGITVTLFILYAVGIRFLPVRFPDSAADLKKQRIAFLSGLVFFYAAVGSPLAAMAHLSFSIHMLRLSLLCWFAPPLILLGMPPGFLRPLGRGRWRRTVFSLLSHPAVALVPFHAAFLIVYYPPVFDGLAAHPLQRALAEAILVLTSFLMWWPVFCPVREWERLNEWKKMIYITISALLLTPVSFWLLFAEASLYGTYEEVPPLFSPDPLAEQKIAGAWMKLVQVFLFGGALTYWFVRWVRKEQKKEPKDRKTAEREAVARLLLNKRVTPGETFTPSRQSTGKSSGKVIFLSDRRRKKNHRIDS